jgi:putative flippase GtrA
LKLVLVYSALAAIATAVNIGAQHLSTRLYAGPGTVVCSMIAGTGVGLAVKYWLDKRFVFRRTAPCSP